MSRILLILMVLTSFQTVTAKMPLILDADTANEVDDLYAIVRALIAPEFEVLGLNSAHWQVSHWATENSLEDSQRLNEVLLGYLEMSDLPHPRGAQSRLYDWGRDIARYSAASHFIIEQAKKYSSDNKLNIVTLGAMTNVASAILIDPDIVPNIRVWIMGTRHDFDTGLWYKRDFNCMNDLNAADLLLSQPNLELVVLPANVAAQMTFDFAETKEQLGDDHPLLELLLDIWKNHRDGGRYRRVIWDLALIEAMLHPEWAEMVTVHTSPQDGSRPVRIYKDIDADAMRTNFFRVMQEYFN